MFKARARRRDTTPPTAGGVAVADADQAIAEADRLQSEGDLLGAIDVLMHAGRATRDRRIERRLVRVRHRAFKTLPAPDAAPADATGVPPDRFPDVHDRPPEVPREELDGEVVRSALVHHGCLLVRNVLDEERVHAAKAGIDRSIEALAVTRAGGRDRWYDPLDPPGRTLEKLRTWVQAYGGCLWMGDSPPMLFEVLDAYEEAGVLSAVTEYLGERPALSLEKSTLRRMPPTSDSSTWHQDGAFIGRGARTLNVWVALNDCGTGAAAPGLDVIPRRFEEILETGAPIAGASLRKGDDEVGHAISPDLSAQLIADTTAVRPAFKAGDGLLFDEMMPHRTGNGPEYTEDRYALESWFFAPSTFPGSYVPIVC